MSLVRLIITNYLVVSTTSIVTPRRSSTNSFLSTTPSATASTRLPRLPPASQSQGRSDELSSSTSDNLKLFGGRVINMTFEQINLEIQEMFEVFVIFPFNLSYEH
jgi:hypothetical protein